jgi:glycosyltransferase involved in cell wall biosynthesis
MTLASLPVTPGGTRRPKLSVLMIAYNVERYLAQALDSALMQDVDFDYEIVVGEDGSTDGTRTILLDYVARHPSRIRPLLRQHNLGMNRNFMETLLALRGEFVALLDADDYWTAPDKLRRQVAFLETHPACSCCFHNVTVIYEDGSLPPHPFHLPDPPYLISHHVPKPISTIADLAGGNFMQTCSVVFRAGLYGRLPDWYLTMPTFDWPLHLLNAEHGDIAYLDEIMGVYRVRQGSFWSTDMVHYRHIEDVELMIRAYETVNRYTGYRYNGPITGQILMLYRRAADVLLAGGHRRRAAAYAIKGLAGFTPDHAAGRRASLRLLARALAPRTS